MDHSNPGWERYIPGLFAITDKTALARPFKTCGDTLNDSLNYVQKTTADENDSSTTSASAPDSLADDEVG